MLGETLFHTHVLITRCQISPKTRKNLNTKIVSLTTGKYNVTPKVWCDIFVHNKHGTILCLCGTQQTNLTDDQQKHQFRTAFLTLPVGGRTSKLRGHGYGTSSEQELYGKPIEHHHKAVIKGITAIRSQVRTRRVHAEKARDNREFRSCRTNSSREED